MPRRKYTETDIQEALQAMAGGMSEVGASKEFGVPRATLNDRKHGRTQGGPVGAPPVLSVEIENRLVSTLTYCAQFRLALTQEDFLDLVQDVLNRMEYRAPRFVDNRPSVKWLSLFRQRHAISLRACQAIKVFGGANHIKCKYESITILNTTAPPKQIGREGRNETKNVIL